MVKGTKVTVQDMAELLKDIYPSQGEAKLAVSGETVDDFLSLHGDFVVKLAHLSTRPPMSLLKKALAKVFEGINEGRVVAFTGMVQKSLSQCKRCSRSITSGQKTSNVVLRVTRALKSKKKARILK